MSKPVLRPPRQTRLGAAAAVAVAAAIVACGGGSNGADPANPSALSQAPADAGTLRQIASAASPAATAIPQPANTEGRLLASNCFQCHGTLGRGGFDSIRGHEADEVLEYLRKPASADIMAAHAQGYTPAQLQKIIAYLQQ